MECVIIVHGKVLTQANVPQIGAYPTSEAFFSPEHGEIWARIYCPAASKHWTVEYAPDSTDAPRNPYHVPGSLIWPNHDQPPSWFDRPLLEREFFLHLNYLRRYKWRSEAPNE